jgi:hypothetical protein
MVLTRPVPLETPGAEVFLTFVSSPAPQAHRGTWDDRRSRRSGAQRGGTTVD